MNILCFVLNTQQTVLCEKYYTNADSSIISNQLVEKNFSFTKRNDCYNPLFFELIQAEINKHNPSILVFTTVNDVESGTYFHSDFLVNVMKENQYQLLDQDKFVSGSTMRMSIYVDINDKEIESITFDKSYFNNTQQLTCQDGASAMVLYLSTPFGYMAFIGINNPDNYCIETANKTFVSGKNISAVFYMTEPTTMSQRPSTDSHISYQDTHYVKITTLDYSKLELSISNIKRADIGLFKVEKLDDQGVHDRMAAGITTTNTRQYTYPKFLTDLD